MFQSWSISSLHYMLYAPRLNPLQTAIDSGSGLEDSPYLSMSRRVTCASDLGCSIGTRVTRVTRVAQSRSAVVFRAEVNITAA